MALVRCVTGFAFGSRVIAVGELLDDSDPIVASCRSFFSPTSTQQLTTWAELDQPSVVAGLNGTYAARAALLRAVMPGVQGIPTDMASPPTVTQGTAGTTTSTIVNAVRVWPDRRDAFLYNLPFALLASGTSFPDTNYLTPLASAQSNAGNGKVTPPLRVSFFTDAAKFEIITKAVTSYRVQVDGQYVTAGGGATLTRANNQFVDLFDFTAVGGTKLRRIDVDMTNSTPRFGGVYVGPNDTVIAVPQKAPRVCVISDSFGEGTGANLSYSSFVYQLANLCGWQPWSSSWGGTGYLNDASGAKTTARTRLTADVLNGSPDVIIWALGYNDFILPASASAVTTEAAACYAAVKAALPNALQIVVGPWWHNGASTIPAGLLDIRDAIKTAATAAGLPFVDVLEFPSPSTGISTTLAASSLAGAATISTTSRPSGSNGWLSAGVTFVVEVGTGSTRERRTVSNWTGAGPFTLTPDAAMSNAHSAGEPVTIVGPPLWTGTGKVGATTGSGNSDIITSSDGVHPTQAGHDLIGRSIHELLVAGLTF